MSKDSTTRAVISSPETGPQPPLTHFDVVSGTISELLADRNFSRSSCLGRKVFGSYRDGRLTGTVGDGYYYLIRARNKCGTAPYDKVELDAAPPCD